MRLKAKGLSRLEGHSRASTETRDSDSSFFQSAVHLDNLLAAPTATIGLGAGIRTPFNLETNFMIKRLSILFAAATFSISSISAAMAAPPAMPPSFQTRTVASPAGADIFVRFGGTGSAVLLIHGFGDTGEMWAPLAAELAKTHTVIVPDLRGFGDSSRPQAGYDKKTQAVDMRAVVTALGFDHAQVVGHDIGLMVAYAYAASYPDKVDRLVVMDAPLPGIAPWNDLIRLPPFWQFSFGGADMERLVAGRERIYLDRFWNEFAGDPSKFTEDDRQYYAAFYARPGSMHASFSQFNANVTDAVDNAEFEKTKLTMPVLAISGGKSLGATEGVIFRNVATNVTEAVVVNSGHWLMEEATDETVQLVVNFLTSAK